MRAPRSQTLTGARAAIFADEANNPGHQRRCSDAGVSHAGREKTVNVLNTLVPNEKFRQHSTVEAYAKEFGASEWPQARRKALISGALSKKTGDWRRA
jgi:hypothetical protein